MVEWVIDKLSGNRLQRGASPAHHGVKGGLDTLVRESLQNSKDQAVDAGEQRPPLTQRRRVVPALEGGIAVLEVRLRRRHEGHEQRCRNDDASHGALPRGSRGTTTYPSRCAEIVTQLPQLQKSPDHRAAIALSPDPRQGAVRASPHHPPPHRGERVLYRGMARHANVRLWLSADLRDHAGLVPLSGGKRTFELDVCFGADFVRFRPRSGRSCGPCRTSADDPLQTSRAMRSTSV